MTLMRWEPFSDLMSLREAMDQLFEDSIVRPRRAVNGRTSAYAVPLDIYQTGDEVVIKAPVPGVRPEDIDVNILGDTVTINGQAKEEKPEQANYLLRELRYGQFTRSITLPVPVSAGEAKASFEHGVLTLRLPKAESAKPRQIRIQASGK